MSRTDSAAADQQGQDVLPVSDTLQLFYRWQQPQSPRAILLIVHGVGEHSGRYLHMMDWACEQGFMAYAFDQRGHGRSGGSRVDVESFQQYADDLERILKLIRERQGNLPVILFSHSMGTLVAMMHAISYPQSYQGLILSSCALQIGSVLSRRLSALVAALHKVLPAIRLPNMIALNQLSHDPAVLTQYAQDKFVVNTVTVNWLHEFHYAQKHILDNAAKISVPVLVMHSVADQVAAVDGARQLVRRLPPERTQYREFETLYHELHNETAADRARVFETVLNWIKTEILG